MGTPTNLRNKGGKGGGSQKKGRNFRVKPSTNGKKSAQLSETRYMRSDGPARHNSRTARNCGCNFPINHSRANRAQHEADKQARAAAARKARTLVSLPAAA